MTEEDWLVCPTESVRMSLKEVPAEMFADHVKDVPVSPAKDCSAGPPYGSSDARARK